MYMKYKLVRNKHVLHAIRSTSIPCVRKIHAINSRITNQNLILNRSQLRSPYYYAQARQFSLIFRGIKGLLKLRYILLGSAVGGGYQVKKVCLSLFFDHLVLSLKINKFRLNKEI